MIFNSREQYALLIVKEVRDKDVTQTIKLQTISEKYEVSLNFLEQVARDLRIAGIIQSKKGPGGGYYRSAEPHLITLLQILNAVNKVQFKYVTDKQDGQIFLRSAQSKLRLELDKTYV